MSGKLILYVDGSCLGNPGPTGAGAVLLTDDLSVVRSDSFYLGEGTNNTAELNAAIRGLGMTDLDAFVEVRTDSAYVVNAFQHGWIRKWIKNDWRTATGRPVANKELWEKLHDLVQVRRVIFTHVPGHNGEVYNDMVDKLARDAAQQGGVSDGDISDR